MHRRGCSTLEKVQADRITRHHPTCQTRRPLVATVHSDQRGPGLERVSAAPGERSSGSQPSGRRTWRGWWREELARSASRPGKPPHMATTGGVRKEVRSPTGRDDRWNGGVWRFASLEGAPAGARSSANDRGWRRRHKARQARSIRQMGGGHLRGYLIRAGGKEEEWRSQCRWWVYC